MSLPRARQRADRTGTRRELVVSVAIAVLVLLLVGGGASFAARWVAQRQSLNESERRTVRTAEVLEPMLRAHLDNEDGAREELEEDVARRMTTSQDLTELVVWSPDGTVLFSNNRAEIGVRAPVSDDIVEALRTGKPVSGFEDGEPEADEAAGQSPTGSGQSESERYVEVYTRQAVEGHGQVVFEAYYDYESVEALTHRLFLLLLPLILVPLLLVQAIQLPIAVSLARRVRRHEKEHSALLEEALDISDRERVRFAADLHDGPIQDLAGIGYALGVIVPLVPEQHRSMMGRVEGALQRAIHSLRGLMTDLYPPDLRTGTLGQAISSLVEPLSADGVETTVSLEAVPPLSDETVGALYRVARESLANVAKHAHATSVTVTLELVPGGRDSDRVRLSVTDDGAGVDPDQLDRRAEGHLGLRLISDRVVALGGTLDIDSTPGKGTTVAAVLPLDAQLSASPPR